MQLPQRLAALPIGVGVDEIVEAFGFGEIELAVLEGAAGEFAGLGGAHILERRQRGEQRGQHRAAAMDVEFGDVFAGGAGGARKPEHHGIVDRPLAWSGQQGPRGHRGVGILPASAESTGPACGPETRTMAMALGARPLDSAKMVWSRGCMPYLSSRS